MERANRLTCPHCGAPLKSVRGVRIGRHVKCVKCGTGFTVRPEDAERAEQAAGINVARLGIVLAGVLLYLIGGAVLAVFCFVENVPPPQSTTPLASSLQEDNEDVSGDWSAPAPGQATVSAADQRVIDDAIAKGVWFLKDHMREASGAWGDLLPDGQSSVPIGFASLPGLTLLECGVPASDPIIQKAADFVRKNVVQEGNTYDTYQRSLAILFLDRLGDYQDEKLIQYLALCLIAGQHPTDGAWTYSCPALDINMVPELLKLLADEKQSLDDWRKTALKGGTFEIGTWDNSNTQFAILALWVAQRHHVAIDRSITLADKTHFRPTQMGKQPDPDGNNLDLDGSWYYDRADARGWRNSSRWPSMTCAGLLALAEGHAVSKDAEKLQRPLDDPAIQRALAMLAREIGRDNRPPDYYFLWSLERVGVLYNLQKIDGKDWYAWGRQVLLERQVTDGSWKDGGYYGSTPVLDTCFALLFLKQANLAQDLTSKLELLAEKK